LTGTLRIKLQRNDLAVGKRKSASGEAETAFHTREFPGIKQLRDTMW
jgi:hypothetical protein